MRRLLSAAIYEHTFVSEEEAYARFRAALAERQLAEAFAAARALPGYLPLADGLELTLLAAEVGASRAFEGCAARWLARAAAERNLTLQQMLAPARCWRLPAAARKATPSAPWRGCYERRAG